MPAISIKTSLAHQRRAAPQRFSQPLQRLLSPFFNSQKPCPQRFPQHLNCPLIHPIYPHTGAHPARRKKKKKKRAGIGARCSAHPRAAIAQYTLRVLSGALSAPAPRGHLGVSDDTVTGRKQASKQAKRARSRGKSPGRAHLPRPAL